MNVGEAIGSGRLGSGEYDGVEAVDTTLLGAVELGCTVFIKLGPIVLGELLRVGAGVDVAGLGLD